jgi:hypothetical protein
MVHQDDVYIRVRVQAILSDGDKLIETSNFVCIDNHLKGITSARAEGNQTTKIESGHSPLYQSLG